MEDWEEFFVQKSRRRSEKERAERSRERARFTVAATVVGLLVFAAVVGLALLT